MNSPPKIAVAGSANIDLITYTDQIPRPGETIFGRAFSLGFGGKGANQAMAARLCGAQVAMVARVGDDLFGPATVQNFAAHGIDTSCVLPTPGVSSGVAPIFVESSGQNRIWVVKGANDQLSPADIDSAASALDGAAFLVMQLEVPLETVYYALRWARARGIRTMLNPAPGQPLDLAQAALADYLIPDETEAEALTGIAVRNLEDAKAATRKLLAAGVPRVIVTLGSNGSLCAGPEGIAHVPAYAVRAVDTTGAGDAFIGSLACFLGEGCAEMEAIARANLYAALSTLSPGTQKSFVTRERFEAEWAVRRE
ncbi:MAG: ribokinase [Candidatus Solibacter sp.]